MGYSIDEAYLSYQAMVTQTNEGMASLSRICTSLGMQEYAEMLDAARTRMKNNIFSVGIMGEFRRGKSTLINALLGKEIVPSDIIPTSATLNIVRWGSKPGVIVHFRDGSEKEIGIDELPMFVTKITPEAKQMAAKVEKAVVLYPCRFCQNGVQIVDTPGLNDEERMDEIAARVIPNLDAIIMVMTQESPLSESEREFLRNKIMVSDIGRIIFVVNKIDNIHPKDRSRVKEYIKGRIQEEILEKTGAIHGNDSEIYSEIKSKLGGIRVYGISARDALKARLDGDSSLENNSKILEFENALSKMLTEERGMLELMGTVNALNSVTKEVRDTIAMRRKAISIEKEEIEKIAIEGMAKIEEERERKKEAVKEVRLRASALYAKLLPELDGIYDDVQAELLSEVDKVSIDPDSVNNYKKLEKMAEKLDEIFKKIMEECLSHATERLILKIEEQVNVEMQEDIKKMSDEINANIIEIKQKLLPTDKDRMFDWGVVAFDALTNYTGLYGIGGILSGWKENGLIGAALGGTAGFVTGFGTLILTTSLAAAAGVGGALVTIPIVLIGGIVSTFSGKFVVEAFSGDQIGQRNVERIRQQLNQAVISGMQDMKQNRKLETWLKTTTAMICNSIADKLDQEIEVSLSSFEKSLTTICLDKQKKESEIGVVIEKLDLCDKQLEEVIQDIKPIKIKLSEALMSDGNSDTVSV